MNRKKVIIVNGNPVVINYYIYATFENSDMSRYRALSHKSDISDDEKAELALLSNISQTANVRFSQIVFYDSYYVDLNNIPKNHAIDYAEMLAIVKECEQIEKELPPVTLNQWVTKPEDLPF